MNSETHTDDALTEAVAKALLNCEWTTAWDDLPDDPWYPPGYDTDVRLGKNQYKEMAAEAIATIRAHDEQDALNCGHCTPNTDEIACACQIKENHDD